MLLTKPSPALGLSMYVSEGVAGTSPSLESPASSAHLTTALWTTHNFHSILLMVTKKKHLVDHEDSFFQSFYLLSRESWHKYTLGSQAMHLLQQDKCPIGGWWDWRGSTKFKSFVRFQNQKTKLKWDYAEPEKRWHKSYLA